MPQDGSRTKNSRKHPVQDQKRGSQNSVESKQNVPDESANLSDLPLGAVLESPFQPRTRAITRGDVGELMSAIEVAGQLTPIIVSPTPNEPGKFYVHSGHRRCAALRFLGRETVRAEVRVGLSDRDARRIALVDNLGREDLTAYEQAAALDEYCKSLDASIEAGAEELGLKRRTAYRLKALLAAPEPVRFAIRERGISARAAELLSRIGAKRPARAVRLANKLADGQLSLKALEREAKQGRSRAAPSAKEPVDVVLKTDVERITLKLDLRRTERTDAQVQRVVNAVTRVLAELGINQIALATANDGQSE